MSFFAEDFSKPSRAEKHQVNASNSCSIYAIHAQYYIANNRRKHSKGKLVASFKNCKINTEPDLFHRVLTGLNEYEYMKINQRLVKHCAERKT